MKVRVEGIIFYLYILFMFGVSLFCYGFFPASFSGTEKADRVSIPGSIGDVKLNYTHSPKISRSILMVIDAFRTDFLNHRRSLKFLNLLIQNGSACVYRIKVHSPTVTMPRIKAITSGTIPSFMDIVLNLGNTEMKLDNILNQMAEAGNKIVFFGDNTWTNMFKNVFHRKSANEDSFFVNDFYEGDKNITRNVREELGKYDWKMMILHYLGLDHIGHVLGPYSDKVPAKLEEMDNVIEEIYRSIQKWNKRMKLPSFLFVTGDHGMRDAGGHGGSSIQETQVPFIVIGFECSNSDKEYEQIDLSPTLAILLGIPIPEASIGSLIPEVLDHLPKEDILFAHYYNSMRLITKMKQLSTTSVQTQEYFLQFDEAVKLHQNYIKSNGSESWLFKQILLKYNSISNVTSSLLAKAYIKYDVFCILVSIALIIWVLIMVLMCISSDDCKIYSLSYDKKTLFTVIFCGFVMKYFLQQTKMLDSLIIDNSKLSILVSILISGALYINFQLFYVLLSSVKAIKINDKTINFSAFGIIFHTFSFASSSFIEEEHQTWYYLGSSMFIILFFNRLKQIALTNSVPLKYNGKDQRKTYNAYEKLFQFSVFFFIMHIFAKKLNQTGDKWSKMKDIGDWLILEEHKVWLSIFLFISLGYLLYELSSFQGFLTNILSFSTCLLIYYYRITTEAVSLFGIQAQKTNTCIIIFWLSILEIISIIYIPKLYRWIVQHKYKTKDFDDILGGIIVVFSLISSLIHKPHNVILNAILISSSRFTSQLIDKITHSHRIHLKIIVHLWLGKMFYFYQGNSNNLASIDLNAGYVGLNSFSYVLVGLFLTINTYSAQILSFLLLIESLLHSLNWKSSTEEISATALKIMTITVVCPFSFFIIIVTILRDHIFVWTVFSPKIIYEFYAMFLMFFKLVSIYLFCKMKRKTL